MSNKESKSQIKTYSAFARDGRRIRVTVPENEPELENEPEPESAPAESKGAKLPQITVRVNGEPRAFNLLSEAFAFAEPLAAQRPEWEVEVLGYDGNLVWRF